MSDFDFLREFGKNMGRDRFHEQGGGEWQRTAAALDALDAAETRRRRLIGWVFPVAVAASFLWLATAFWRSEQRADGLRNEVEALKAGLEKIGAAAEPVTRQVEVVRFDTVYRTVIVRRVVEEILPKTVFFEKQGEAPNGVFFENKKGGNADGTAENPGKNLPANEPDNPSAIAQKNGNSGFLDENRAEIAEKLPGTAIFFEKKEMVGDNAPVGPFDKRPALTTSPLPVPMPQPVATFSKKHLPETGFPMLSERPASQREQLVRRLRSPDFRLGGRTGLLLPVTDRAAGNSFSSGLTLEKDLTSRLGVVVGVDFGQMFFHVSPDKLADSGLPLPPPPTPDAVLKRASVGQPILDFSAGVRYGFLLKKRLNPYVSAAWVGEKANRKQLRYEYIDPTTDSPSQVRIGGPSQYFNATSAQIGIGADWGLRHWAFGVSGFFQKQFAPRDEFLAERFGLRAGFWYAF